ncbi:MAG: ornithine carbamoyltransferase [Nitrospinae bacterium]|nr:ornithine carbamoyltransferase [Nitrospinota bacterium]
MKKDFISLADFSSEELEDMISLARKMKEEPSNYSDSLRGKVLGMIFYKKSTRTRLSFEVGILQLGGFGIFISPDEMQVARGETLADTAKALSRYLDGIMIRTFAHEDVVELAQHATVPVINGLTDYNHPCQALADMMTIDEKFGQLRGKKLAYIGDGNNMALSLMVACIKFGMNISIVSPEKYSLNKEKLHLSIKEAELKNIKILLTSNVEEGVSDADIVYTDVWASMGQDEERDLRVKEFAGYCVDSRVMSMAKNEALFMHCLPAHRGEEVSASVIDGKASIVFDQVENRLHLQKAILYKLMKQVSVSSRKS